MVKRIIIISFLLFCVQSLFCQELDCNVIVNSDQIQGSNKQIFEDMQKAIYNFMNTRKWTNDKFSTDERIECSLLITINKRPSQNKFQATLQIQSRRPVYNTSYNSTMIRYVDNNFDFDFAQYQPLIYSDQNFTSDLTSVLAFYAYYIIGTDYDSFSLYGGTPYFKKAQTVVTHAQASQNKGWKAYESTENRYWMAENMLSTQYKPLRECMYEYYIKGFDTMAKNVATGRATVLKSLQQLVPIYEQNPMNFPFKLFFDAHAQELVNLFSKATPQEQVEASNLLNKIDPANSSLYDGIRKSH